MNRKQMNGIKCNKLHMFLKAKMFDKYYLLYGISNIRQTIDKQIVRSYTVNSSKSYQNVPVVFGITKLTDGY